MRKVSEHEYFRTLFGKTLFPDHYIKDSMYDIRTIAELERIGNEYHVEIFYRECGTWLLDHMSDESIEDQGVNSMKKGSVFSIDYKKEIVGNNQPIYFIRFNKH